VRFATGTTAVALSALMTVGLLSVPAHAAASPAPVVANPGSVTAAATRCTPPKTPADRGELSRFYRPTTKYQMKDRGPQDIRHVREAQYRLRWAGQYKGKITGYYGVSTRDAVRAFQKKSCLPVTGTLDRASWARLIVKTTRQTSTLPKVCKSKGWHSCYHRSSHQDFLFKDGQLINVWLVRGGSASLKTRTGTYKVFGRYAFKRSSLYGSPMWYFQKHSGGQGQHGSGLMTDPFVGHSHGCINMYIKDAKVLWKHTKDQRLTVTVYGSWS
jgi:Putative peptidoglycan binding domain/L,D-transpeptidase catalytic domain